MHIGQLTPLQRRALLAGLDSPSHSFDRRAKAFVPRDTAQSPAPAFTHRLMNMMDRAYLTTFDNPDIPRVATLTKQGLALAHELKQAGHGRAVAA